MKWYHLCYSIHLSVPSLPISFAADHKNRNTTRESYQSRSAAALWFQFETSTETVDMQCEMCSGGEQRRLKCKFETALLCMNVLLKDKSAREEGWKVVPTKTSAWCSAHRETCFTQLTSVWCRPNKKPCFLYVVVMETYILIHIWVYDVF